MRTRELERFKRMLLEMREQIMEEVGRFEENTLHKNIRDTTGEVSVYKTHPADDGAETAEYEKAYILAAQENELLELINDALQRIEDGSYGICVECDEKIPMDRLKAIPYTPYCIYCKENQENSDYVK